VLVDVHLGCAAEEDALAGKQARKRNAEARRVAENVEAGAEVTCEHLLAHGNVLVACGGAAGLGEVLHFAGPEYIGLATFTHARDEVFACVPIGDGDGGAIRGEQFVLGQFGEFCEVVLLAEDGGFRSAQQHAQLRELDAGAVDFPMFDIAELANASCDVCTHAQTNEAGHAEGRIGIWSRGAGDWSGCGGHTPKYCPHKRPQACDFGRYRPVCRLLTLVLDVRYNASCVRLPFALSGLPPRWHVPSDAA